MVSDLQRRHGRMHEMNLFVGVWRLVTNLSDCFVIVAAVVALAARGEGAHEVVEVA